MIRFIKKKIVYPIIGAIAFVFALVWAMGSMPEAYAETEYVDISLFNSTYLYQNFDKNSYTNNGVTFTWNDSFKISSTDTNGVWIKSNSTGVITISESYINSKSITHVTAYFGPSGSSDTVSCEIMRGSMSLYDNTVTTTTVFPQPLSIDGSGDLIVNLTDATSNGTDCKVGFAIWLQKENTEAPVTISAGTGVHDVFLSSKTGVTTGDASGTVYSDGTTVYGYARLYGSYKPQSDWIYICKDNSLDKPYYLYLIGSKTINGAAVNFGTINAILRDPKAITLNNNGGEGSGSVTITPNESTTVDLGEICKDYADFAGWNTKADGSGITYTSTLSEDDIDVLFGDGIETLYAQWVLASNIQNVINLIDAIGTVTLDSEEAIVAARSAYDALTNGEKTAVSNYATLTAAEARLDEIKTNIATGDNVKSLIDEIGEVTYPASGNKINAARSAYDALTNDEQRARVTNYATLTAAETAYEELKVNGANAVSNMINNLGEATLDSEDEVVAARSAYDALTGEQKILITAEVYGKLTSAEATLKSIHDQIAADAVKELIANIGDVEYSEAIKNKLDTANTRYEALTSDQKVLVTNYNELETKTNIYVRVEAVYVLIDSINNVTYNNSSKKSINEAREAYDSLSDDEKELVINYSKLTKAETKYNDLKNDHEVFVGWMIALGIILGIILVLGVVYVLFFFVFNKWIVIDEKPVRVFRIGKKNDNVRLLKMTFMVIYRDEEAIFNKKEDIK